MRGGKSGHRRDALQLTAGWHKLRESGTETKPPMSGSVRRKEVNYSIIFLGYPTGEGEGGFSQTNEVFNSRTVQRKFSSDQGAVKWGKEQEGNILDSFAVHLLLRVEKISTIYEFLDARMPMSSISLARVRAI